MLSCTKSNALLPTDLLLPGHSNFNFLISNRTEFSTNQIQTLENFKIIGDNILRIDSDNYLKYCLETLDAKWIAINLDRQLEAENTEIPFCHPLIAIFNMLFMGLVIYDFHRSNGSRETKLGFRAFLAVFILEQIILIAWFYFDLRELIILKNFLTIFYYFILIDIWLFLIPSLDKKKSNKISIVILSLLIVTEVAFLTICFVKNKSDPITIAFPILIGIFIMILKMQSNVEKKILTGKTEDENAVTESQRNFLKK